MMTKHEALRLMKTFRLEAVDECVIPKQKQIVADAFDMAIEALDYQIRAEQITQKLVFESIDHHMAEAVK